MFNQILLLQEKYAWAHDDNWSEAMSISTAFGNDREWW